MRSGRVLFRSWILLALATVPLCAAPACAAQNAPTAPRSDVGGTRFLSLLPELVVHTLEGTQRSRELVVDLESFQAGAVLFARATLSRDQLSEAFGRPVRDLGSAAVGAGELPPGAVHLALNAMIDLGAYVEATATVSWSTDRDTPAGRRTVRIVFARSTNGYRFESVRPLVVT